MRHVTGFRGWLVVGLAVGCTDGIGGGGGTRNQSGPGPEIGWSQGDTSRPLRELAVETGSAASGDLVVPAPVGPPPAASAGEPDPVIQTTTGAGEIPSPGVNFEGIGVGLAGYTPNLTPPDPNGDVGPSHYVEIVNADFAVFSKTGQLLAGPIKNRQIWSGFAGPCGTDTTGPIDPLVKYDKAADRWFIMGFLLNAPNTVCMAVSTSPDPAGSYHRYAFTYNGLPDYPKVGVWNDTYVVSYNMFNNETGARICGYERAQMLTGGVARAQCFLLGSSFFSLLPSDRDGSVSPPAGAPNYLVNLGGSGRLNFWKLFVDWTDTSRTRIDGPQSITVAAYTDGTSSIPEPGGNILRGINDRLMFRLAYRTFGTHESLVVSHAVSAGTTTGIRWYELRNPGGTPVVHQQGTYGPADSTYRWMSSLAMDAEGNMALGFSRSSGTIHPQMRYTGRLVSDPLGTMGQGEGVVVDGTGSETGGRWGDYINVAIDPSDDCTFWYVNQYLTATGARLWRTRIASIRFPSCATKATHVSAASYRGDALAPASIVAAFGTGLATTTQSAQTIPLPTTLGGTTVKVRDSAGVERSAGIFFVSPNQVNYELPAGTAPGNATISITSGAGARADGTAAIAVVAPGFFSANASGKDVSSAQILRVKADGTQTYEAVARFDQAQGKFVPIAISFGPASDRLFLVQYGTGWRGRSDLSAVSLTVGGGAQAVSFAGAHPNLVGLDQLNAELDRSLGGRGTVDVAATVDGKVTNVVSLTFGP